MELDEMKQLWNGGIPPVKQGNTPIAEMIKQGGPIAEVEKSLRYTIYFFSITVVVYGGKLIDKTARQQHPLSWLLFAILLLEFVVALFNLAVIRRIQPNAENLKDSLGNKIGLLKRRLNGYLVVNTLLYVTMAILSELTLSHHWDGNFEGWNNVPPWIRYAVYALFISGQHIIKHRTLFRMYGKHLQKLEKLMAQLN